MSLPDPNRRFALRTLPALLALGVGAPWLAADAAADRVVRIKARRFSFTPDLVKLKKGEPVVLELTTEDIFMGMNIPDFNVRSDIVPDKVMRLRFVPDKSGTFDFVCDVFCGGGHEGMHGKIVVG